jgi:hypothetical protein
MRITSTQLRRIVKEEVQKVTEAPLTRSGTGPTYPGEQALRAAVADFEAWANKNVHIPSYDDEKAYDEYHSKHQPTEKLLIDLNAKITTSIR